MMENTYVFSKLYDFEDKSQVLVQIKESLTSQSLEISTQTPTGFVIKKIPCKSLTEARRLLMNYTVRKAIAFKQNASE